MICFSALGFCLLRRCQEEEKRGWTNDEFERKDGEGIVIFKSSLISERQRRAKREEDVAETKTEAL